MVDRDAKRAARGELGGPDAAARAQRARARRRPCGAARASAARRGRTLRAAARGRRTTVTRDAGRHEAEQNVCDAGAILGGGGQKRNCTPNWTWSDSGSTPLTLSPAKRPKRAYSRRRPSAGSCRSAGRRRSSRRRGCGADRRRRTSPEHRPAARRSAHSPAGRTATCSCGTPSSCRRRRSRSPAGAVAAGPSASPTPRRGRQAAAASSGRPWQRRPRRRCRSPSDSRRRASVRGAVVVRRGRREPAPGGREMAELDAGAFLRAAARSKMPP